MQNDQRQIRQSVWEVMWYMRGSISMNEAWGLTFEDKKQIQEFLKENQERFKGAMSPIV